MLELCKLLSLSHLPPTTQCHPLALPEPETSQVDAMRPNTDVGLEVASYAALRKLVNGVPPRTEVLCVTNVVSSYVVVNWTLLRTRIGPRTITLQLSCRQFQVL